MIYYIKNTIQEMLESEANKIIQIKTMGEVTEKSTSGNKYKTQGVITTEKKHIDTVTDIYTTEAPPTITENQKLDLVKKNGAVKWVKVDFSSAEQIAKKNNEITEIKKSLSSTTHLLMQGLAGELDQNEYAKILAERKKEVAKIKKLEREINNL